MKHKFLLTAGFLFLGIVCFQIKAVQHNVDLRRVKLIYGKPYLLGEYFNPVSKIVFVFDANKTERTFTVEVNEKKFERDSETGLYKMLGFVPTLSDYSTLPEVDKTKGTYEIKGNILIIKYIRENIQEKIKLTRDVLQVKKKIRKAKIINDRIIKFLDTGEIYVKYNPADFQPPVSEENTVPEKK